MGFIIEKQLTNARPPKTNVAELVTTPTPGNMRLTEKAAELLGVKTGDYVGVVQAKLEEGGASKIFVHKGWADEKNGNVGSKVASPNGKTGGSLLFSSAYAYQTLGGSANVNRHFTLADDAIVQDDVAYYEVTFDKETAKAERAEREEEEAQA